MRWAAVFLDRVTAVDATKYAALEVECLAVLAEGFGIATGGQIPRRSSVGPARQAVFLSHERRPLLWRPYRGEE